MAALYDLPLTMKVLEEEIFRHVGVTTNFDGDPTTDIERLIRKVKEELCSNVAEASAYEGRKTNS